MKDMNTGTPQKQSGSSTIRGVVIGVVLIGGLILITLFAMGKYDAAPQKQVFSKSEKFRLQFYYDMEEKFTKLRDEVRPLLEAKKWPLPIWNRGSLTNSKVELANFLYEPQWSCKDMARIGEVGDGAKFVCDVLELSEDPLPCIVYSVGSADNFDFENNLLKYADCEIHTFDPKGTKAENLDPRIHFHPYAWVHKPRQKHLKTQRTWDQIMKELGHDHIDILKIDVEGGEYGIIPQVFSSQEGSIPIWQMIMETHFYSKNRTQDIVKFMNLMDGILDDGFRLVAKETNEYWPAFGKEWAFIYVNPECPFSTTRLRTCKNPIKKDK
mmetsp:Transcript_3677/g.4076  ORF Transcript_3677/g.4076 Transcript_3677/m.4076 type:complete len:325 (+) Transcript_3677:115-1089(+)